jgi:ribose-phosphate pyrophosphokinase
MVRAAVACREHGAKAVYAFAAHGLFTGDAATNLADPAISGLFVSDTVPPFRLPPPAAARVETIPTAPLFAEAIRRIDEDGSLIELLGSTE